jgi:hypothetical protein
VSIILRRKAKGTMRVRIHDSEVAAAFMGLARLRPDVVLAPAPAENRDDRGSRGRGHGVFDVGLIGSYDSVERRTEVASIVRGWTCQLRGRFRDVALEIVS